MIGVGKNWFRKMLFILPKLFNYRKNFWFLPLGPCVLIYTHLMILVAGALELKKRELKRRLKLKARGWKSRPNS